jgi:hypothetical protein
MTITAASGVLSFGGQVAKGTLATEWYRHRAIAIDLDAIDEVREGAPEVGGIPVPTFPYKSGPVVAGGFTLQPRLEDTLGWLLHGTMGDVDSAVDDYDADIYNHEFILKADAESYVPYMSFRKAIPGNGVDADTDLGQIFKDCKIIGTSLVLPNSEPVTMRVDVLGREFSLDHDPSAWTDENEFEHWESIPVACVTGGYIKIGGVEYPVVQATLGFQNVPLDIRQERIFGDPFIEDVTIVQRRLAYDITVKYNDPDLYAEILTKGSVGGGATGTIWGPEPKTASLDIKTVSSVNMTGKSEPYSLRVQADEVMMSQVGGVALAAGQGIMMRFTGVALEATNYAKFTLRNLNDAGYVWPT